MELLLTVGQVSKLFNITSETLRHYDRVGLLKPRINQENGYRYYSIKEIEMLELILDAKYLEIPLSNIKEIIKNDSVENYIELIELQEKTIDSKINHLLNIKKQAKEKKIMLKNIRKFENIYDFSELSVIEKAYTIMFIPIKNIINNKVKQRNSLAKSLYLEPWMTMYKCQNKNTLEENNDYVGIYKEHTEKLLIEKDEEIIEKYYKCNIIKTKFVGTISQMEEYIKSIIDYFYEDEIYLDIDISIKWIWVIYNEKETINFMEISIPLKSI